MMSIQTYEIQSTRELYIGPDGSETEPSIDDMLEQIENEVEQTVGIGEIVLSSEVELGLEEELFEDVDSEDEEE